MDLKITPSGQTIVKPTALGPGANTDTKLLIYGLFQKGRVLAQDDFYSAYTFCTPEHGGTHIDAPVHFSEDGWPLGDVPIERLIAPGVIIDVSEKASQDRDYRLSREDVEQWETANGRVPSGAIVLLRTERRFQSIASHRHMGWERF